MTHDELHDHDRGLAFDLRTLSRRRALSLLGGGALVVLVGCGSDDEPVIGGGSSSSTTGGSGTGTASATSCDATIPEETAGPYPGDGSNGPDVLTENGVVRSDIRSSFGSSRTTAKGVPLTINLVVQDQTSGCKGLDGAAVYVWHCDREGRYSLYSQGAEDENYLRGVQAAGSDGRVTFTSVFPGAYSGRWPHIHFEVYESVEAATSGGRRIATSQIALPEDACKLVYATDGYEDSVGNLARTSLATDNVFGDDGGRSQLGTVSGSVAGGYAVELAAPVDPAATSTGGGAPGGGPPRP